MYAALNIDICSEAGISIIRYESNMVRFSFLYPSTKDDAGIARYIRACLAIAGNCVLCSLHHSKRSKEARTSTDLFSKSGSHASYSLTVRVAKTATHMHIVVHPCNAVQCVYRQSGVFPGERPVAVITPCMLYLRRPTSLMYGP